MNNDIVKESKVSKLRILHIIKSLGRGGAEMLLPETLKLHNSEAFEFHYIYFLPWKNQMVESIREAGGKVTCLRASNNLQILTKADAVLKYCDQHNIRLIHCHLPWAGFLGRRIHRKSKIPVIYTEHNKQERYHFITRFINRFTFNLQSCAIAVSQDVADSIAKNIRPSVPVFPVLNGVNVNSFQRNPEEGRRIRDGLSISKGQIIVGTIAVFRFQKRLEEWITVMKVLCDRNPDVFGLIVGDGPLKEAIIEKRKSLNLEDRIFMPGLQTDVKPWLSAIDIYMMTSVFEGMPIALLEAMSMECAVASTKAGGIVELIRDSQDGLLVDVDDWQNLTAVVGTLMTPSVRAHYARQARARVVESFSLDKMVKQLEEIYIRQLTS